MSANRWTVNYPLTSDNTITKLQTVQVGQDIIMLKMEKEQFEMWTFNCDVQQWKKVAVKNPEFLNVNTRKLDGNGKMNLFTSSGVVYLWREQNNGYMRLLKFDVVDLEWTVVRDYPMSGFPTKTVVIGESMYFIERDHDSNQLIEINMGSFEVKNTSILPTNMMEQLYLMDVNDTLYLIGDGIEVRTVSEIIEGNVQAVGTMYKSYRRAKVPMWVSYNQINQLNTSEEDVFEVDSFNVTTKKWKRTKMDKTGYGFAVEAVREYKNNLYTIFGNKSDVTIRVFERVPGLATMCLLKVTDTLKKTKKMKEIEEIKKNLPSLLRDQLSAVADWREEDLKMKRQLEEKQMELEERKSRYGSQMPVEMLMRMLMQQFNR